MHSYIEPTEQEREEGKKIPTVAHNALADLVRAGYVRVIVTTNFDRLMENALRERGVEPTIVASVDALKGAEPIAHSACYILKLHGDYKDARILNTDAELSAYPDEYDHLIDRIFDEYGLIVCGWSGEWDHALRAAFLRSPNRRYPVFWAARGDPGNGAAEIVSHRNARVIQIPDADSFFSSLWESVQTLEQSHRQNPLSVELLVNSTKRYLSKPEYRIQIDELFAQETDRLIEELDSSVFAAQGGWNQEDFRRRIACYEAASEPLARMAGVLGRWGDGGELSLLLDVIGAIRAHADKIGGGLTVWLNIRSYPAVLVFTAYGLGLARSQRWETLHLLLSATISRQHDDPKRIVEAFFLGSWEGGETNLWNHFYEPEKRKTPLSDHLLTVFREWSKSFEGISPDFEFLFEQLEMLASIAYVEGTDPGDLERALADPTSQVPVWMPVGRSAWHGAVCRKVLQVIQSEDTKKALLEAGFANGSDDFLEKSIAYFRRMAARI